MSVDACMAVVASAVLLLILGVTDAASSTTTTTTTSSSTTAPVLPGRVQRVAVCSGVVAVVVNETLFTAQNDDCGSDARLLHAYNGTAWHVVSVVVGKEEQCSSVGVLRERLVNETVTRYELQNVTLYHDGTQCKSNTTEVCDVIVEGCGLFPCGLRNCCLCAKPCETPVYCTVCGEYYAAGEPYVEVRNVSVAVQELVLKNVTVQEVQCVDVDVYEARNTTRHVTQPNNCASPVYEDRFQTQECVHGACNGGLCVCDLGWQGNACDQDVAECDTDNGGCQHTCLELEGSFECSCNAGFKPVNTTHCRDVDECLNNTMCEQQCVNNEGSYACTCFSGYVLNETTGRCDDANECLTANGRCSDTCTNSPPGSYTCSCSQSGFELVNGTVCIDTDECDSEALNSCSATDGSNMFYCVNQVGGYRCVCPAGYTLQSSEHSPCVPVNCSTFVPEVCTDSKGTEACRPPVVVCNGTTYGRQCSLFCPDANFALAVQGQPLQLAQSSLTATCLSSGAWSHSQHSVSCTRINAAPTAVVLSGASVLENQARALVGLLSVVDVDAAQSHVYTLSSMVGGTFVVESGNRLVLLEEQDFESWVAQASDEGAAPLSVRVTATDPFGESVARTFAVNVTNVNEAPTAAFLTASVLPEMAPQSTLIGALVVVDPDGSDDVSAIVSVRATATGMSPPGPDVSGWVAAAGNGLDVPQPSLALVAGPVAADYEMAAALAVTVRVRDRGGLEAEFVVAVTVADANDRPDGISLSNRVVPETARVGSTISSLQAIDADTDVSSPWLAGRTPQALTFSLVAGPATPFVGIVGTTLVLLQSLDHEQTPVLPVTIVATDNGDPPLRSSNRTFQLIVEDVNEAPFVLLLTSSLVSEAAPVGSPIAQLLGFDPDASESLAFRLLDDDQGTFGLAKNVTCLPYLAESTELGLEVGKTYSRCVDEVVLLRPLDFEARQQHDLSAMMLDETNVFSKAFVLGVEDANEPPAFTRVTGRSVMEDALDGTLVSELFASDPDENDRHRFTVLEPLTQQPLHVLDNELLVGNTTLLDYERASSFTITLRTIDSGKPPLAIDTTIVFDVENVNEAPVAIWLAPASPNQTWTAAAAAAASSSPDVVAVATLSEFAAVGEPFANITVIDPDNGINGVATTVAQTHDCFLSGEDAGVFVVGPNDNVLRLGQTEVNFEQRARYDGLELTCVDSGTPSASLTVSMVVVVHDENEPPSQLSLSGNTVSENAPVGTTVGSFHVTDPDQTPGPVVLVLGHAHNDDNANALPFALVPGTALLQTTALLDSEGIYTFSVTAKDTDGLGLTRQFEVEVTDANDTPTAVTLEPRAVVEGASAGTVVGALTALDQDLGQTHTFRLVSNAGGGNDNALFLLRGNLLTVAAGAVVDFERAPVLRVHVEATDNGLPLARSVTTELNIVVLDVNEPPTAIGVADASSLGVRISELAVAGTVIGQLVVTDPDNDNGQGQGQGQTHFCEPCKGQGLDTAAVRVDSRNQLLLRAGAVLDFEAQRVLTACLSCTDSGSPPLTLQATVSVAVANANEPPAGLTLNGTPLALNSSDAMTVVVSENGMSGTVLGQLRATDPDNACFRSDCPPRQRLQYGVRWAGDGGTDLGADLGSAPDLALPVNVQGDLLVTAQALDFERLRATSAVGPNATVVATDNGVVLRLAVVATDDGKLGGDDLTPLSVVRPIALVVTDADDPPTGASLVQPTPVPEDAPDGFLVGRVVVADPDEPAEFRQHSVQLDPAQAAQLPFLLDGLDLLLQRKASAPGLPDFETAPTHSVTVLVQGSVSSDGIDGRGDDDAQQLSFVVNVTVGDALERHTTSLSVASLAVPEDIAPGTLLAEVVVSDPDNAPWPRCVQGCRQSHSCVVDPPDAPFYVVADAATNSRWLAVALTAALDHESSGGDVGTNTYTNISVVCHETNPAQRTPSSAATVAIVVENANDAPHALAVAGNDGVSAVAVAEGTAVGTVVGRATARDQDVGQTLAYTLVAQKPVAPLRIDPATGQLTVADAQFLNHEQWPAINATITVTDNGTPPLMLTRHVVIRVTDSNDAPSAVVLLCGCQGQPCPDGVPCVGDGDGESPAFECDCADGDARPGCNIGLTEPQRLGWLPQSAQCLQYAPSMPVHTVFGTLHARDEDGSDVHRFELVQDTSSDWRLFDLAPTTGTLRLSTSLASLGAASLRLLRIVVRATDLEGHATDQELVFVSSACAAAPKQCSPDGGCVTTLGGDPLCVCRHGWQGNGTRCIRDGSPPPTGDNNLIGTCAWLAPCENGGTCVDRWLDSGLPSVVCQCTHGYGGALCETRLVSDACASTQCFQGGECIEDPRPGVPPSCRCPIPLSGRLCTTASDGRCKGACSPEFTQCVPMSAGPRCVAAETVAVFVYSQDTVTCQDGVVCSGRWGATTADFELFLALATGYSAFVQSVNDIGQDWPSTVVRVSVFDNDEDGVVVSSSQVTALVTLACSLDVPVALAGFCSFTTDVEAPLTTPVAPTATVMDTTAGTTGLPLGSTGSSGGSTPTIVIGVIGAALLIAVVGLLLVYRRSNRLKRDLARKKPGLTRRTSTVAFENPTFSGPMGVGDDASMQLAWTEELSPTEEDVGYMDIGFNDDGTLKRTRTLRRYNGSQKETQAAAAGDHRVVNIANPLFASNH
eukprot:m.267763 g.267763  ORF g.267763 m.267763 type:complete len:2653 (-) comp19289_c0_seq1:69-8027(-)